jgi:hypothetical protein
MRQEYISRALTTYVFRSFHSFTYCNLPCEHTAWSILKSLCQRRTSGLCQQTERSNFRPSSLPTQGPLSQRQRDDELQGFADERSISSIACTPSGATVVLRGSPHAMAADSRWAYTAHAEQFISALCSFVKNTSNFCQYVSALCACCSQLLAQTAHVVANNKRTLRIR